MTPHLRTGMSVGLIPRGEVGSVNNEQHKQNNRYDNHQDDHGFSVHQGTFPSAVPPGHRPRRNTAYSGILSFQYEVTRRDGSKYARGSTRAICAGKGVRWTPALRLPSVQATGQAVRADRTWANLYDLRNTSPTPDSPTSTKASSAASLGPGSTPSRRPCNTTCAHDHEALAGFPDQIRDVRRPKLALR